MKCSVNAVILGLKRADTPFYKRARSAVDFCRTVNLPVPSLVKPVGRVLYEFRLYFPVFWKRFKSLIYLTPVFSCRCESLGKRLQLCALPVVKGHTVLHIGDDIRFDGNFSIASGRFYDRPVFRLGSRTFIGHNVSITCNREVTIEDDVLIAANCRISDYDGHPAASDKRLSNCLPDPSEIRPVRICKGAWIGTGVFILKGVTIGAGSVVGANSVVTRDVPPGCVVAGSPAKIVKQPETRAVTGVPEGLYSYAA